MDVGRENENRQIKSTFYHMTEKKGGGRDKLLEKKRNRRPSIIFLPLPLSFFYKGRG